MRIFTALAAMFFSLSVSAATSPMMLKYQEGRDYTRLEAPVPTLDPAKIEVVEAFSFTCPHCYNFEPALEQWKKQQKPDVVLVQTHMQWSGGMKPYQRGFYTSVFLKMQDKVMMPIFEAIHKENKYFESAEKWAEFFATQGVKKEVACYL
jgi:thiol:disulfide interchange protein DsbA